MNEETENNWRAYSVTILLLILNIAGYILCTQSGETVYETGCMDAERVLLYHEYYRLLTAVFLHADIEHIVSNMIFLVGLGEMVERAIGHMWFAILYLLSGLCGSALSMAKAYFSGELYRSVGASGAIYGLIGALIILVIIHNGRFGAVSIKRLLFATVYMIYSGVSSQRVDNAAHIGGLIGGIFIMAVMNLIEVFKREENNQ